MLKDSSGRLSQLYKYYLIYECVLINLVGFFTLFFQCELQGVESSFLEHHPNTTTPVWQWDIAFGHYWLKNDLNCSTRSTHCLTYMVAGWLMIAGVLQLFINFDSLRQRVFPNADGNTILPRSIKLVCLYIFFVCDWYWVVLMSFYSDVIGWQQMAGSALDIAIRLVFVFRPSLMFDSSSSTQFHRLDEKKSWLM